ncbi:hypothetical protein WJX72_008144 [[Myrmecia] bisecta]|uniref:Uncharacterized protein n=1 Tax=[Myrmecia] bisecta TaxID=41462 RepID=A0AAW1PXB8_9CHLO
MYNMGSFQQCKSLRRAASQAGRATQRGWHARAGSQVALEGLPGEDVSHVPVQLFWHASECAPAANHVLPEMRLPWSAVPLLAKEEPGFPGPEGEFQKDMPPRRDVPPQKPNGKAKSPDLPHPDGNKSDYSTPGTNPDLPDHPKKEYTPPQKKKPPQNASAQASAAPLKPFKTSNGLVGLCLGEAYALDEVHFIVSNAINEALHAARSELRAVHGMAEAQQAAAQDDEDERGGSGTVHPHLPGPDHHGTPHDAPKASREEDKDKKPAGPDSQGKRKQRKKSGKDEQLPHIAPETGLPKDVNPGDAGS